MVAVAGGSSGLTRSEIESMTFEHLESGAQWLVGEAGRWESAGSNSYNAFERAHWRGPGANAAEAVYSRLRSRSLAGARELEKIALEARQAAIACEGARGSVVTMIDAAENAGFTVQEDLQVTFGDGTDVAALQIAAAVYEADIRAEAADFVSTLARQAGILTASAETLAAFGTPTSFGSGIGANSDVQPASFSPKLSPAPAPGSSGSNDASGGRSPFDDKSRKDGGAESSKDSSKKEGRTPHDDDKSHDRNGEHDEKSKEAKGSGRSPVDDVPSDSSNTANAELGGRTPYQDAISSQPVGPAAPSPGSGLPASPLGSPAGGSGAGGLKPPSLGSPTSPMTSSPGAGGGMQPAAFDKAVAGLGNNVPPAAAFTPPPGSGGAGSTAPVTSTPAPVQPVVPPPAAAAAPAPAAPAGPAPAAAPVSGHGPMTGGGGMMPPLLAGGGAPPAAPMSAPPPAAPPPAAPPPVAAASGHVNAVPPMLSAREHRSAYVAARTGDRVGKLASDVRQLCGQLMATTRNRPGVQWVVGGSLSGADQVLIVANNIGLGWMPSNARLFDGPENVMHAFVDGDIDLLVRRDWVGDPLRAVRECGRLTGHPITALAVDPYVNREGVDLSAMSVEVADISPQNSGTDDMRGGRTRAGVVDPAFAKQIDDCKEVAPIVRLILPGAGHESADRKPSNKVTSALWNSVITDAMVSVDHHLQAWQRFCEDQLAVAAYKLRRQEQVWEAKDRAEDYVYWEWNLAALGQLLKAQPLGA